VTGLADRDYFSIPKGVKHIHCIGIGGSGMFPIVQILLDEGFKITGSDNNEGEIVRLERELGINVIIGQKPENIAGADLILYSAAIMESNPELIAARESGLPLWERARMLGAISARYKTAVGICGTHGKTTVTSMLTQILYGAGMDPSAVIGGKLKAISGYGRTGTSDVFIYEACEFKDTFLMTFPKVAVVLNIDNDHMDYFGTVSNAMRSYTKFCEKASTVIFNGDDLNTREALKDLSDKRMVSVGIKTGNEYYAANIRRVGKLSRSFDLMHNNEKITNLTLNVPGEHNVFNALAAAAAACELGVPPGDISKNLAEFFGAGRRFEVLGVKKGFTVADDYAHHPAELTATLKAAKELGFERVWAIFQPFTFSRTYMLLEDFAEALSIADITVLSPIMGSREVNSYNIHSDDLAQKIPGCVSLGSFEEIAAYILENAEEGDLVITLGCGDIYKCAHMIMEK